MLAAYAAAAIQNARLHENTHRLAVLEERELIGMDLHDGIIQAIYGVGLSLEGALLTIEESPAEAKERIRHSIDGLNQAIRDLRAYILDLRPRQMGNDGLMSGLRRLATEFRTNSLAEVVLVGPDSDLIDLHPSQALALFHICQETLANTKDFLIRGGRLLILLEPFEDGGLKDFLSAHGVGLNDGLILDQNQLSQVLGASAVMPIAIKYGPHRITQDFTNAVTIYPLARPLEVKTGLPGMSVLPLVSSNPSSWEKVGKDWIKKENPEFDPKRDRQGPFTLPCPGRNQAGRTQGETEKKKADDEKTAYLAVFGDADFADNGYFNFNQSTNGDLFLNTVNFLAAEEKQIVIRRAEQKSQPLTLTRWQAWMLFLASIVLIPLVMLVAGVSSYLRRRARR